jgi:NADP-dependent 3-hydroxy acid dehydrogenase YdfG
VVAQLTAKYKTTVAFHEVDVCKEHSVERAVEETLLQFSEIDTLVTAAGMFE